MFRTFLHLRMLTERQIFGHGSDSCQADIYDLARERLSVQFASMWSAREAAVGPNVQDGGALAKSPDFTSSINVADQLYLCLGLGCLSWRCGSPHILSSFIHFVITCPAQGNVLAVLPLQSRWLNKSSLVIKRLGHLAWKILVPGPTQRVLFGALTTLNLITVPFQLYLSSVQP